MRNNNVTVGRVELVSMLMDVISLSYHVQSLGSALHDNEFTEAEDIQIEMSVIMRRFRDMGILDIPEFLGESLEELMAEFLGEVA